MHQGVRAGLENHADNAYGATDLVKLQAGVKLGGGQNPADRIVELNKALDSGDGLGEFAFVELQPLQQRGGQIVLLGLC